MEPNETIVINSFKLVKNGVEVSHSKRMIDPRGTPYTMKMPNAELDVNPHPDLVALIRKLTPHYMDILEQRTERFSAKKVGDAKVIDEYADEYPVRGIIFKDGTDYSGVMLSGHRKLSTGHAVNMLTRLVKFDEENDAYQHAAHLQEVADALKAEILLLLDGKHARPAQTSIMDPEAQREPEPA